MFVFGSEETPTKNKTIFKFTFCGISKAKLEKKAFNFTQKEQQSMSFELPEKKEKLSERKTRIKKNEQNREKDREN